MAGYSALWEARESIPGRVVHWRVGPLDFWVRRVEEELWTAVARENEERDALVDDQGPERVVEWRRWAVGIRDPLIKLTPAMPDLPVIVRPSVPLQILRGNEAQFFIGIPIWVRLTVSGMDGQDVLVCEEATISLSKSWFGSPDRGELCYALKTRAKRMPGSQSPAWDRAVCPLLLKNESEGTLDFKRLCLRVRELSVYGGMEHMWSSAATVEFTGEDVSANIAYADGPPAFDGAAVLIGDARLHAERSLISKTLGSLKAFMSF